MKKIIYLFVFIFAVQFQVQAQNEKATVYLLRPSGPDEFVPYFTYLDTSLLCKLGNGRYSVHEVDPGEYKMHAQYKGKIKTSPETELPINFEAGKTYYIQISISTKAFGKGKFYCEQLSLEDEKEVLGSLIEDKKCL
jgi:hypothetical protein